ncbi:hypothetical protein ACFE04_028629 [Oxalis oulophora]
MAGVLLRRRLIVNPKGSAPSQTLFSRSFASRLFVKGLAFSTTEETLANAFSKFGKILQADVVMNKTRNQSKGFGYVTFDRQEDANKALTSMNGAILEGRSLFVDDGNNAKLRKSSISKEEE